MKLFIASLVFICLSCQSKKDKRIDASEFTIEKLIGSYEFTIDEFTYRLKLNADSTFEYACHFSNGETHAKGNWKSDHDTLILYDYEKPWEISYVEEKKVDTLSGLMIVVAVDALNSVNGLHGLYDFKVWINDNCDSAQYTDNDGRTKFVDKAQKISFIYDSYKVKKSDSNCITFVLNTYPLYLSPASLSWTKLIWQDHSLIPLECDNKRGSVVLKK